jgi:hypothetical protein
MSQIYDTPAGPALLVRTESVYNSRGGSQPEYVLAIVSTTHRMIMLRRYKVLPEDFKLIHDPAPRAEADILAIENRALIREKAVLLKCLASALGQLPERSANQVRDIYLTKIKPADMISQTEPGDLVGASKGE